MTLHADWVVNDWVGAKQIRKGRVVLEDLPDGVAESIVNRLADVRFTGSYAFLSVMHDDDQCPFRTSDELRMVPSLKE